MLAYWYNAPRHIKLIFIIVVCAAIYAANQVQPLSSTYTILSLVLGFGLHFGQYLQTKIPEHSSYKSKLQFLLGIYPLIIVAPSTQLDRNTTSFRLCTGWIFSCFNLSKSCQAFLSIKFSSFLLFLKHAIIFHGLLIHEPSPFYFMELIRTRECYACIFRPSTTYP